MYRASLWLFLCCFLNGCSSSGSTGGQAQESDTQVAERIKTLLPEASSIPIAEWEHVKAGVGNVPVKIEDWPNQPLSLVIVMMRNPLTPKCKESLWEEKEGEVFKPSSLSDAMEKSKEKGYATLLQPEFISEYKCSVEKDKAAGTVTFRAKGALGGKVEFTARRTAGGWSIEEFRLPGCEVRVQRGANGKWKLSKM